MIKIKTFLHQFTLILILLCFSFQSIERSNQEFSEKIKIVLREVGNQLLLIHNDSTSLILPIQKLETNKYQIEFENNLTFQPKELVTTIKSNIEKLDQTTNYRVEVVRCLDEVVVYSFEVNQSEEKTIIPCLERKLPIDCYRIQIRFLNTKNSTNYIFFWLLLIPLIVVLIIKLKPKKQKKNLETTQPKNVLGMFLFYPEQHKLVQKAKVISLSKKECELLTIFIDNLNNVVKREELTKKVWEDNGVFVSRSLDTYVSKLRKKLQEDSAIKLVNVHGVGYKLEIKQ